jgi:hypothetical protein
MIEAGAEFRRVPWQIRRRIWRMTMQRHACHEPSLLETIITDKNNRK